MKFSAGQWAFDMGTIEHVCALIRMVVCARVRALRRMVVCEHTRRANSVAWGFYW